MTTSSLLCRPRFATPRRPERPTLGPYLGEVARRLGKPYMPWQQQVADVLGEYNEATGRLYYTEYGLTVPRQSGKSTFVLVKAVHRCSATKFYGNRQNVVYTAQTRQKAREKWEVDYAQDLDAARVFNAAPHFGNGNEHLSFPNRSRFGIEASTEKAGHGKTIDEAFIDEAFAQPDSRLEQAFRPAMITRKNKQLGWISTAGWLGGSPFLEAKVPVGRLATEEDTGRGLAYFEWSAPEGSDPGDPEVWLACMPAVGHTITLDDIADEYEAHRKANNLNGFKRAYLNMWVPKMAPDEAVIDLVLWAKCVDYYSAAEPLAFAIDVAPDDVSASLLVAGRRPDGLAHLEVICHEDGTDWIVAAAKHLYREHRIAFYVDPRSPAGAHIKSLREAGVFVVELTTAEYAAACQSFVVEAKAARIRHQGWPAMAQAIEAAVKRDIGDGGWGWARKKVTTDISPLVAATLAMHGMAHPVRPRGGTFRSF